MHVRRAWSDVSRLNPEKIAFALASAWLLVTALSYLDAPEVTRWGPARTGAVEVRVGIARSAEPDPLDLSGDNPFRWREDPEGGAEVVVTGGGRKEDERKNEKSREMTGEKTNSGERGSDGDGETQGKVVLTSTPSLVSPKGSIAMAGKARWFVFEHTSTGHYYSARKGEAIGELGLRVAEVRNRTPVIEYAPPHED